MKSPNRNPKVTAMTTEATESERLYLIRIIQILDTM